MATSPLSRLLRFLPLAALGVALSGGHAEAAAPTTASAPSADAPFLYEVDGLHKPSYLFGTIHAGVAASELSPAVGSALERSELFVMETSPTQALKALAHSNVEAPMDLALAQRAHQSGLPIATLESLRFQVSLLAEIGNAEDLAAILAEDPEAIEPLVTAYRSGELEQIHTVADTSDPHIQEILLNARNRRWAQKLSPILRRGGVFVAAGVGHFPGEEGLLTLLRDRGLSVSRVGLVA